MQVDTKILKELAKIAAKKNAHNPKITMVRLDGFEGKARLWATDGHCLVVYTLDAPAPEVGTSYDVDYLKKLTRDDIIFLEGSSLADKRGTLPLADDQKAPDIDQVIPARQDLCRDEYPNHFGVNPELIARAFDVVRKIESANLDHPAGRFQMGADKLSPIRFDYGNCTAIVMPCRIS